MNGFDPGLNMFAEPSSNPVNYGGIQAKGFFSTVIHFRKGWLKDNKLGLEYGIPLYEHVNGIQQSEKRQLNASWSYKF